MKLLVLGSRYLHIHVPLVYFPVVQDDTSGNSKTEHLRFVKRGKEGQEDRGKIDRSWSKLRLWFVFTYYDSFPSLSLRSLLKPFLFRTRSRSFDTTCTYKWIYPPSFLVLSYGNDSSRILTTKLHKILDSLYVVLNLYQ